jgi:hypothetical protein
MQERSGFYQHGIGSCKNGDFMGFRQEKMVISWWFTNAIFWI